MAEEDIDSYVQGIMRNSAVSISLQGTWNAPPEVVAPFQIIYDSRKFLWILWWAERHVGTGTWSVDPLRPGNITCKPIGNIRIERARWWRRGGFHILRRIM